MKHSLSCFLPVVFSRCGEMKIDSSRRNVLKAVGAGVGALAVPGLFRSVSTMIVSEAQATPSAAQISVLYDAFGKTSTMQKDWGFAAFIEYGGKRILFDTGNNAKIFAHNVKA